MTISEQDKQAIDQAVRDLHFVSVDEEGRKSFCPFYPDYRETNEPYLQTAYDNRKIAFDEKAEDPQILLYTLQDEICGAYDEQRWDVEDEIMRKAGFDPSDDMAEDQIEYLRDEYDMQVPLDHFMNQKMFVNIMLDAHDEGNRDFVLIQEQYEALCGDEDLADQLSEQSGLTFLVQQQGYTIPELKATMEAYRELFYGDHADHNASYDERYEAFLQTHNPFLSSVCQELDNIHNYMNCLTILAKVDMYEFAEMMQPGKEITFSKDAMVGVYSPWNGAGSLLEIALEKDLTVSSDKIWDIQIEGAELDNQYSVNTSYGLIQSCWKDVKGITEAAPEKKPALDSKIQAAQKAAEASAEQRGHTKEINADREGASL